MPVNPLDETQIAAIASREQIEPALVRDIAKAAVANDVPPTLLLAVAKRETDYGRGSGYDAVTGRGDSGHGYGMFQLDDRTPAHTPFLAEVQHDPARAANVAAAMIHESLTNGTPAVDAMHIYNAGSLDRRSTKGMFEGRMVPYETAVVGWAREYDAALGIGTAVPSVRQHVGTPADQALVNSRISEAAEKMRGMSTRNAQTHTPQLEDGNLGCAYSINKVLDTALGRTYGANRDYVPSVMADLQRHGSTIAPQDVRAGDIAIKLPSHGETHGHIGIVTRGGESPLILNNDSRLGSLSREDSPERFSYNYKTHRDEDRVVYLRVDPASVDLSFVRSKAVADHVLGPAAAPPDPTHWTEYRPTASVEPAAPNRPVSHDRSRTATGETSPADRPLDADRNRHDLTIHGEMRSGHLVETPEELVRKNAIMAEAARDARRGDTLDFRFIGNGRETAREVAAQNEKLQETIATHLPAGAMPHLVKLTEHRATTGIDSATATIRETAGSALESVEQVVKSVAQDVKRWTPDMPFQQFEQFIARARGGTAHSPVIPEAVRTPTQERTPDLGR